MNTSLYTSENFLNTWGEFLDKTSDIIKNKIFKTIPTGAYDIKVSEIIQNASRPPIPTMKDISITESQTFRIIKGELERESLKIENKIDNSRTQIDKLIEKNESVYESNKKINLDKINKLNKEIDKYIEELIIFKERVKLTKRDIDKSEHSEMVFRGYEIRLDRAEFCYRKSKKTTEDLDFLKKIVHYSCETIDKFSYGTDYIAPYPGHLLDPEKSPFTEEVTARKNKNALVDWYDDNW
jgi:hypothetical protein